MTIRSLVPYLGITFGITWGLALILILLDDAVERVFGPMSMTHPLFLVAVYAPAIAALMLVARQSGVRGLGRFLGRLTIWRCHPGWYAFIGLGIPLLVVVAAMLKGSTAPEIAHGNLPQILGALGIALVVGPVEEIGWRGVMLPVLQQRLSPLSAGLVVGAVWGIWHLPAFLLAGTPQSSWSIAPFLLSLLPVSVIMTALLNASRGSLLLAALMHFQLNNPLLPDAQPVDAILLTGVAVAVVWLCRKTALSRSQAVVDVVPNRACE